MHSFLSGLHDSIHRLSELMGDECGLCKDERETRMDCCEDCERECYVLSLIEGA